jgi:hypothetical protein
MLKTMLLPVVNARAFIDPAVDAARESECTRTLLKSKPNRGSK